MQPARQLKIGLLNDLHYDGSVMAMNRLYEAVSALNRGGIELLAVLGDLVDSTGEAHAERLLREVSALCGAFRGTIRYLPGNHDLDHLSKEQFYEALGLEGDTATCRFDENGIALICLDGNFKADGAAYRQGNFDWSESAIPDRQLAWLQQQLGSATAPVLLFSHQRLDVESEFAVRNHAAVREVIQASGKVKAVFQGHQHTDDLRQIDGIAYYTLGAHKEGAGPAVIDIDEKGIRLIRDFTPAHAGGESVTD